MQNKFDKGENMIVITDIKDLYYGNLRVKKENNTLFYWSIENWQGEHWHPISKELYSKLLEEQNGREQNEI